MIRVLLPGDTYKKDFEIKFAKYRNKMAIDIAAKLDKDRIDYVEGPIGIVFMFEDIKLTTRFIQKLVAAGIGAINVICDSDIEQTNMSIFRDDYLERREFMFIAVNRS